jgi:hypothetical protein
LETEIGDVVGLFGLFFEFHAGLERSFIGFFEVAFAASTVVIRNRFTSVMRSAWIM